MGTEQENMAPLNDALNKPKMKYGLDYRLVIVTVFACIPFFLLGQKLVTVMVFAAISGLGKYVTSRDRRMIDIWLHSFSQAGYYDPAKRGR